MRRAEALRVTGAAALIAAVFLPWFSTGNEYSALAGRVGAGLHITGWDALPAVGAVLVIAVLLPLLVAHVLLRDGQVSWRPGELTAVTGTVALTAVLFWGLLNRPGGPSGEIGIDWGWWVALAGALMMVTAAALRTSEHAPRKPPGV